MSDETVTPIAAPQIVDPKEIEAGKTFAILSYVLSFVWLPFFIVPLVQRENTFALYHAKQVMLLWLAGVAMSVVCGVLFCLAPVIAPIVGLGLLALAIMGLLNAIKGEMKPLPLIGKFAEEWFKGITKKA